MSDLETLSARLIEIGRREGGPMFLGKPDRWNESPRWRCANDHVSQTLLKSEHKGGYVCRVCFKHVCLTFPEDRDGPLVSP